MELKGTRDWSDFDPKDGSNAKSNEASKQPLPEAIPERPAPLLDLGIIFNRRDMPKETLKSVSEEYDRVAPEVAQGLTLGSKPELSGVTGPTAGQQAQAEAARMEAVVSSDDDEDESSEEKEDTAAVLPPTPIRPPLPVSTGSETSDFILPIATEHPQEMPLARPTETEYNSPSIYPTLEARVMQTGSQVAENSGYPPIVPEQTPVQPNVAGQPFESVPPPVSAGGAGNLPPAAESFAQASHPEPESWNPPDAGHSFPQSTPQSFNKYSYQTNMPNVAGMVSQRTFENAQADMRRKYAARMILAVALTWYLTRRPIKPLRKQVSALQETTVQQNEQISHLTYEQQAAQQRIAEQQRQIDQFTQPQVSSFVQEFAPPVVAPQPQQHAEAQPAFMEQPEFANQRQELAGSYSAVFDARNRPIPEAMPRGQEYQQDRSHELVGARDARFTPGAGSAGGYGQPMASSSSGMPTLPSGQVVPAYMLPMNDIGQTPNQEAQHLLNAPKPNPAVLALTSPWLWLGVGILLIAFFVAATI